MHENHPTLGLRGIGSPYLFVGHMYLKLLNTCSFYANTHFHIRKLYYNMYQGLSETAPQK